MDLVKLCVRQPVTVAVGVILTILAGVVSMARLPIQLTPNVDDTVIAVTTRWEGASPQEIEQDVVDKQEDKLQSISGLVSMTSTSQQDMGRIRLEFAVGIPKELALREVSDKLREVPEYPENVDEPVVEASDPENQDFIAWIAFKCSDPTVDVRTLFDFVEDRVKPQLERVPGISEVNVLGGREREVQVHFDPVRLAQRGVTLTQLAAALRTRNRNVSAGEVADGKLDVRLRTVGQYDTLQSIEDTILAHVDGTPVRVGDVAEATFGYKEPRGFVRSRGEPVVIMNADREVGTNIMEVMDGLKARIAEINAPGGLLDNAARGMGIDGTFHLEQVYDQTIYIRDALDLVETNIWLGGGLAVIVLLLFLRSLRSLTIIGLSIPVSIVGATVVMVALGRTVNVISLAGMAFAVGMVVDNSIVVLENVFRHLEMGKRPMRAAYDGAREVWLAVLASTLTTIVVFVPVLMIEEEAGQLFRDISLAICATVGISMLAAVTIIPSASARWLKEVRRREPRTEPRPRWLRILRLPLLALRPITGFPAALAGFVRLANRSILARVAVVTVLSIASLWGSLALMPPADYLPIGNRNLVFGMMIPPPGYNLEQETALADRIEAVITPYVNAGKRHGAAYEEAKRALEPVPTFDFARMAPGPPVTPPPIENYFLVSFEGMLFHGAIAREPERITDVRPLFQHATRAELAPGVMAFAFQMPLFRLGGQTGSAIKVDLSGPHLDEVTRAGSAVYGSLVQRFGPMFVQPEPANFDLPSPEMKVVPLDLRLAEAGLTTADLALAVQASGDGAVVSEFRSEGDSIDLTLRTVANVAMQGLSTLGETPVATARKHVVRLGSLARIERVPSAPQINRVNRQRAVTLQLTPPQGMPLEQAMQDVDVLLGDLRAAGAIPPSVQSSTTGSASKLTAVQRTLLGDGSFVGTLGSSLVIALAVTYLLLCVLFQSFLYPLVILFSVPLATFGGFAALALVHAWSLDDPYLPVQNLDVLTMLGFVILIGVVVNNAILIVHQSLRNRRGFDDVPPMPTGEAIAEAVRTRVRPIFMSMLTSVGGMLPLVLMPGSGSELYRGLGSVVVGGLVVSTIFTLVLVPLLLGLVMQLRDAVARGEREDALEAA